MNDLEQSCRNQLQNLVYTEDTGENNHNTVLMSEPQTRGTQYYRPSCAHHQKAESPALEGLDMSNGYIQAL